MKKMFSIIYLTSLFSLSITDLYAQAGYTTGTGMNTGTSPQSRTGTGTTRATPTETPTTTGTTSRGTTTTETTDTVGNKQSSTTTNTNDCIKVNSETVCGSNAATWCNNHMNANECKNFGLKSSSDTVIPTSTTPSGTR